MEWIREHAWESWLALSMLLAVSELASLDFVLLMLAAGALAGMVAAGAGAGVVVQVLVAVASGCALLLLLRPVLIQRLQQNNPEKLGIDRLVGSQAVVTSRISGLHAGQVRLHGEIWTASTREAAPLEVDSTVIVVAIDGATAVVATEGPTTVVEPESS